MTNQLDGRNLGRAPVHLHGADDTLEGVIFSLQQVQPASELYNACAYFSHRFSMS